MLTRTFSTLQSLNAVNVLQTFGTALFPSSQAWLTLCLTLELTSAVVFVVISSLRIGVHASLDEEEGNFSGV